mgnify:CR=1 FL=1
MFIKNLSHSASQPLKKTIFASNPIPLNLEYFIAKRLTTSKHHKSSISKPIIKIAISAIAIGIIMMIVSVATGVGLQQKIREKVAAFNGHIEITNYDSNQSDVTLAPISKKQTSIEKLPKKVNIQVLKTTSRNLF